LHHHHADGLIHKSPPSVRRLLLALLLPVAVLTVAGLVALWPKGISATSEDIGLPSGLARATVASVDSTACPGGGEQQERVVRCRQATARITSGSDSGSVVRFDAAAGVSALPLREGNRVVLGKDPTSPPSEQYYFVDRQRGRPLLLLGLLFAAVVIALGRKKGVSSLVGLALSLGVLVVFVLPAILEGKNPVIVAAVGASTIMFVALYMSHGFNLPTTTAVLGTISSLWITTGLAFAVVHLAHLSGATSEEAIFVNISVNQINLQGLLLGGIVIGALGVLDDVTITQASAVWEIHLANPALGFKDLYQSALRIGRDHIASTVNTLVLAYAGASLPLLVLFTLAGSSLGTILTGEIVAEEVVRTLVGSIGLVASVPITTGLTAFALTREGSS